VSKEWLHRGYLHGAPTLSKRDLGHSLLRIWENALSH